MPPILSRYRWRRLQRESNRLSLYELDRQQLVLKPYVKKVPGDPIIEISTKMVDSEPFELPPGDSGRAICSNYYAGEHVWFDTERLEVDTHVYFKDPVLQKFPSGTFFGGAAEGEWFMWYGTCTMVYERDGGTFPISGEELKPYKEETPGWEVFFAAMKVYKGRTITFECAGGDMFAEKYSDDMGARKLSSLAQKTKYMSEREYYLKFKCCGGGSISPIEFEEKEGDPQYRPADDPDFRSATR